MPALIRIIKRLGSSPCTNLALGLGAASLSMSSHGATTGHGGHRVLVLVRSALNYASCHRFLWQRLLPDVERLLCGAWFALHDGGLWVGDGHRSTGVVQESLFLVDQRLWFPVSAWPSPVISAKRINGRGHTEAYSLRT